MTKYKELSTKDRAAIIRMHVKAGVNNLPDIERSYNDNTQVSSREPIRPIQANNTYLEKLKQEELRKASLVQQGTIKQEYRTPNPIQVAKETFSNKDGVLGLSNSAYKDAGNATIAGAIGATAMTMAPAVYAAGTGIINAPMFGNSAATLGNLADAYLTVSGGMGLTHEAPLLKEAIHEGNKKEMLDVSLKMATEAAFLGTGGLKAYKELREGSTHLAPMVENLLTGIGANKATKAISSEVSGFERILGNTDRTRTSFDKGFEAVNEESGPHYIQPTLITEKGLGERSSHYTNPALTTRNGIEIDSTKFALGGNLFGNGGEFSDWQDEGKYRNYHATLPNNLKNSSKDYDMRSYWEGQNKPSSFDYSQPKNEDGLYHAGSRNPNTGQILKSPKHHTFNKAIESDKAAGYIPMTGYDGKNYTISPNDIPQSGPFSNQFAEGGDVIISKVSPVMPSKSNNFSLTSNTPLPVNTPKIVAPSLDYSKFVKKENILLKSSTQEIPKQVVDSTKNVISETLLMDNPSLDKYKEKTSSIRKEVFANPKVKVEDSYLINDIIKNTQEETKSKESEEVINKFYNKFDKANSSEVTRIQKDLLSKGYDLGKYGADGKFGNMTKFAYDKENSKLNTNTVNSLPSKILDNISKQSKNSEYTNKECATFVSDVYNYNVLGNAWEMKDNIEKNLGTIKYNIYDDKRFANVKNADELKKLTKEIKKDNKASADMFKVGDVVGIYWDGSSYHETARKDGKGGTKNTHVGFVSSIKDGIPIITHNIHGKLYHSKYNTLTVGWVGAPKTQNIEYANSSKETNPEALIKHYSNQLVKDSKLSINPKQVEDDVYGILKVETGLGKSIPSSSDIQKSKIVKSLLNKNSSDESISQGIGKMKIGSFTKQEQDALKLDNETINDPQTSIKAATYLYLKNFKLFNEYATKNPHLKITKDDIRTMTILSYNQGTNRLLNLGYNNKNKNFKEELESLRTLATDKKISDVSSTKFQYLPSGLSEMAYKMKYGEGHSSYPSRVLNYGKKRKNELDLALNK